MLVEKAIDRAPSIPITKETAKETAGNIGEFYEVIFKRVYGLIKEVEENKTT